MSEQGKPFSTPLDDRAELYGKWGDMVGAIARRHHNIDVDELTQTRWHELMGLMREVDTWADDTGTDEMQVLGGIADFSMFQDRYPHLAPDALSEPAIEAIAYRTVRILKLGRQAAEVTSVPRYVALRVIEAREAVNLFADTATPHVTEQPDFNDAFMPTLRALGEAATLWDSIIDGRRDVRTGKQKLAPTKEYYTQLSGAMMRRIKLGGAAMLHVEPNVHLAIQAGWRVANRVRKGVPEYSSLRILSRKGKVGD
jgi:hypothetical protein